MRLRLNPEPSGQVFRLAVALLALGGALLLLSFAASALPSLRGVGTVMRMPVPWLLAAGLLLLVMYAALKPSADPQERERDTPLFSNSTDFVPRSDERLDAVARTRPDEPDARDPGPR